MTGQRQEFIKNLWRPYPSAEDLPSDWVFGRIRSLSDGGLELVKNGERLRVSDLSDSPAETASLGPSISPNDLQVGDVVAIEPTENTVYLLAPNLKGLSPSAFEGEVRDWNKFLFEVDQFFRVRGFDSIQSPSLVTCPGVDAHIDPFQVTGLETKRQWYLPTSPEIHLKKMLCLGFENIYEVKQCFRDDLDGANHSPEFTMLEWYRSFSSLESLARDVEELFGHFVPAMKSFQHITVAQAFKKYLEFDLSVDTSKSELISLCRDKGVDLAEDDDWNTLFFRLFMDFVEPQLGTSEPVFLWGFPRQQASLAQIDSNGWARRFEVYWRGVELANAYSEVNDPRENQERFNAEAELRKARGHGNQGGDGDLSDFMALGMPPCSGIALGLDRLFMVVKERQRIGICHPEPLGNGLASKGDF